MECDTATEMRNTIIINAGCFPEDPATCLRAVVQHWWTWNATPEVWSEKDQTPAGVVFWCVDQNCSQSGMNFCSPSKRAQPVCDRKSTQCKFEDPLFSRLQRGQHPSQMLNKNWCACTIIEDVCHKVARLQIEKCAGLDSHVTGLVNTHSISYIDWPAESREPETFWKRK